MPHLYEILKITASSEINVLLDSPLENKTHIRFVTD